MKLTSPTPGIGGLGDCPTLGHSTCLTCWRREPLGPCNCSHCGNCSTIMGPRVGAWSRKDASSGYGEDVAPQRGWHPRRSHATWHGVDIRSLILVVTALQASRRYVVRWLCEVRP